MDADVVLMLFAMAAALGAAGVVGYSEGWRNGREFGRAIKRRDEHGNQQRFDAQDGRREGTEDVGAIAGRGQGAEVGGEHRQELVPEGHGLSEGAGAEAGQGVLGTDGYRYVIYPTGTLTPERNAVLDPALKAAMQPIGEKPMADTKKTGTYKGKSNALGHGGRAKQLADKGVPGPVIGAIARRKGAAPGGPNYHPSKRGK
jgi:hypothetical protein